MKTMKVVMIASEVEPFAKTGGLADVVGSLPPALGKLGMETHVFMPRYAVIKESAPTKQLSNNVTIHFVDHDSYFKRPALYGDANGDYPDNPVRFSYFCRQVFFMMKQEHLHPDILHAHDWQSALSIVYLAHQFREDPAFAKTASVFTIHNLAYQGLFPKDQYPVLGLPWGLFTMHGLEFYDQVNLLKGGLVFSDAITTVSPTYAREIQTPEQGCGLDGVLRERGANLVGILNGIDQDLWNPATDKALKVTYTVDQLAKKAQNKTELQKEAGLPVDPKAMVVGMVTRLASQKGLDLVVQALPKLATMGIQLIILGAGDKPIEEAISHAAQGSKSLSLRLAFDPGYARRIYAGSDAFLMPSQYEPCGLGQMIAMRYGTVPIVRATGGLADTVFDLASAGARANGFTFRDYNADKLVETIGRAVTAYRDSAVWKKLQQRGMSTDFSWDQSAKEYIRLYERVQSARSLQPVRS